MARPSPADPAAAGEAPLTPDIDARQVRILKFVVIFLGILILAGFAKPTATIAIAAILIAGGGLIAAKDMFRLR